MHALLLNENTFDGTASYVPAIFEPKRVGFICICASPKDENDRPLRVVLERASSFSTGALVPFCELCRPTSSHGVRKTCMQMLSFSRSSATGFGRVIDEMRPRWTHRLPGNRGLKTEPATQYSTMYRTEYVSFVAAECHENHNAIF